MFGKSITLFKLLGFKININASWVIIAVLLVWSLALGYFPFVIPKASLATYWLMGCVGAVGLFTSIVLHELGHAVVARRNGLRIRGITLFIFGGVAEMEMEPPTPKSEFMMAIAGPIVSVLLAIGFAVVTILGRLLNWPTPINSVFGYLSWINGILVIFNMIPAFPLDGGRVLRSILWARRDDLRSATRTAANIGAGFGLFLMLMGLFSVVFGNFMGGIWWFLIGIFLRGASRTSYQNMEIREFFEGEPIAKFMMHDPVTVPPDISVDKLVHDYVYRYHFHQFPVKDGDKLLGTVGTREVKALQRSEWPNVSVVQVLTPCSEDNTVVGDTDAVQALSHMSRNGTGRLMVVTEGRLAGIVSLRDMLRFFSVKLDLAENGRGNRSDIETRIKHLQDS